MFLSEPQIFKCDVGQTMRYLDGEYCYDLNSPDRHDPDLPLAQSRAHGGTMILWKRSLDPFIIRQETSTSAFLPILFQPPDTEPTIHFAVYLPTRGQENLFLDELACLSTSLDFYRTKYPASSIYLRGDFNISRNNTHRNGLLDCFMNVEGLYEVPINHTTYHHFRGGGSSDSHLDKLLLYQVPSSPSTSEALQNVFCNLQEPLVESHHDIIMSRLLT